VALEAVMAKMSRRCRSRQNQIRAQEWPRAAMVAPLVVQELLVMQELQLAAVAQVPLVVQEQQLAAVAQPLVVQVPLAAMEPQTQRPRRPQATGPQSPPSAELCEQGRA
jgi:hypothetical protein